MGGSSKSNSYSTSMPPWARNAHKRLIAHAEQEFDKGFLPYVYEDGTPAQRLAGFHPQEMAAFDSATDMFNRGDPSEAYTNSLMGRASDVNVGRVDSPYTGREYDFNSYVPEHDFGSITDPGNFEKYMSPYTSQVVDPQIREAQQQFNMQDQQTDAQRVASGARGGYREALQQAVERPERGRQLAEIRGAGQEKAYQDATSLFGADRNMLVKQAEMHMKAFQNDQARLIESQRLGDASSIAAANMNIEASKANIEASLGEIQRLGSLAKQGSEIGTQGQQNALARMKILEAGGRTQRGLTQAQLETDYNDWVMQNRDYPWMQITRMGAALQGVPTGLEQTATQQTPGQSILGQLLGMGIMGGALSK